MGGFVAGDAVEPLSFDFSAFDGPCGTTPEPSQAQHAAYLRMVIETAKEATGEDFDSGVDAAVALSHLNPDQLEQNHQRLLDGLADLTSGEPSRDVLAALPMRVLQAYVGFLSRELFASPDPTPPKDTSGATRRSRATRNGAALAT